MKIVMKDIFLKWIQSTQNNYLVFIKNYHFYQKEKKQKKQKNYLQYREQRKICHTHNSFKTSINGLKLKTVHRVIKFQQKALLKSYIDMNTKLRKEAKNEFEKRFL